MKSKNNDNFKFIEAFSGSGGMGLGLEQAGFDLLYAFDINEKAVRTHNENLGNRCEVADVNFVSGKRILERFGIKKGELELFAGGPPCQGFSKQKKGAHSGDKRNDLVLEYIRLVNEIMPQFFIFENVAIFGQKRGKKYLDEMQIQFTNYNLYPNFYNSANFGLAQTRERFIIVGQRKDSAIKFTIPEPTVNEWITVGQVLKDLPEPPEDFSTHPVFPNHQNSKVSEINIKRFSFVPEGGGWQDIPYDLRLESHRKLDTSKGGWPDVYGRLEWNGQCPTITGGFDSFTRGRFGHPKYNRPLTAREAARLQGFPDSFVFYGNRGDVRLQIGNAVPPPLAKAIGIQIKKYLLLLKLESKTPTQRKNRKMA